MVLLENPLMSQDAPIGFIPKIVYHNIKNIYILAIYPFMFIERHGQIIKFKNNPNFIKIDHPNNLFISKEIN
jgi:hypothetical protein